MEHLTEAVLEVAEGAPIERGLEAISARIDGAIGIMTQRLNRRFELAHCGTSGVADELVKRVEDRFLGPEGNIIVAGLPRAPWERLVHAATFIDWDEHLRSPLYRDYCLPAECYHTGQLLTSVGGNLYFGALGMMEGADWPGEEVLRRVETEMRAVFRAFEAGVSRASCDAGPSGRVRGLVLDAGLRFWHLSTSEAETLVRLGLLTKLQDRTAAAALSEGRLGQAAAAAREGRASRLIAKAPDGQPFQIRFTPGPALRTGTSVVLEAEPLAPASWDAVSLGETFGLTRREAELALHLLHGGTTSSAAERYGLTRETLRTYLRSTYHKTGTGSQVQLVALLNGAPQRPG